MEKKPCPCWLFFSVQTDERTNERTFHYFVCVLFFDWCVFMLLFFCMSRKHRFISPLLLLFLSATLFFSGNHLTLKLFKPLQADWKLTSNLFRRVCACVCEIGTKTDSNHHHHDHKKFHSTLYTLSLETPPVCLDTVLMLLIFTQTKKRVMRVGTHFSGNLLCYRRAWLTKIGNWLNSITAEMQQKRTGDKKVLDLLNNKANPISKLEEKIQTNK